MLPSQRTCVAFAVAGVLTFISQRFMFPGTAWKAMLMHVGVGAALFVAVLAIMCVPFAVMSPLDKLHRTAAHESVVV